MAFSGFSTDRLVSLPPELFSEVLPAITLPSELKVTLHVFYRLSRQRAAPRRLSWDELAADRTLRKGLRAVSRLRQPEDLLSEGLEAAVHRTTLLHVVAHEGARATNWYAANTATNRAWAEQINGAMVALAPAATPVERLPLLTLYEQNIGLITPLLLDELRDAEERYPNHWIEDAMREAVLANARSWRYIRKVLERWATNGRQHAQDRSERPIDVEKYTSGQFGDIFRRGSDESGL
ncbi:MAG: DnaD domain protein [Chloroflexales bacterium]|nr:DnaD domain protein [Chloroflexales bacterium]